MESERLGVLEAQLAAHSKADEIGFSRINTDTAEIKNTLRDMQSDLRDAIERIHGRIDEEAGKARHSVANIAQIARAETKVAMDFSQDAHNRISGFKIWLLGNALGASVAIIGVLIELIQRYVH